MSSQTVQYPDANSKRKFADLNKSNSSEDSVSPTTKPVYKAQKYHKSSSMTLTKEDLVQLRKDFQSDIKVELKEQLAQCLSPLIAKVSKLENSVENLDQKFRAKNLILHGIQALAS
jgi:L-lactate utilization protein LutC